jgi:hypothetical protein
MAQKVSISLHDNPGLIVRVEVATNGKKIRVAKFPVPDYAKGVALMCLFRRLVNLPADIESVLSGGV